MSIARRPGIFVSSTFYDLHQVRDALRRFIADELGYTPLLSEHPTFPVELDATTIENCQRRVRNDTDLLVLIVGSRYGHVPAGETRSVVNLEYDAAREAGIPVFVFIERRVVPLFDMWTRNPSIDLSKEESSPSLMEFIKQIRQTERVWTFEFDVAEDLIDTLRIQLAYRAHAAFSLLGRIERRSDESPFDALPPAALRAVIEKKMGWSARVFSSVLTAEIEQLRRQRQDYEDEIALGPGDVVLEGGEQQWMRAQTQAALRLTAALNRFINVRLTEALTQNDLDLCIRAAHSLAETYKEALSWSRRIRCAQIAEIWQPILEELARSTRSQIEVIESIGPTLIARIEKAVKETPEGETVRVDLTFTIVMHNSQTLSDVIERQALLQ